MKIYRVKVNGKTYKVELEAMEEVKSESKPAEVKKDEKPVETTKSGDGIKVLAPIQGNLVDFKVKVGDKVKKGQTVAIVEAMKLENEVGSPSDGVVASLDVSKGSPVNNKQVIMTLK